MFENSPTIPQTAWIPDAAVVSKARLTRFMSDCGCPSWEDFHRRSVSDVEWFTEKVLHFLNIRFDKPFSRILDLRRGKAWPQWCVDGVMNITKTCLDKHLESGIASAPAVIWEGEEGLSSVRSLT